MFKRTRPQTFPKPEVPTEYPSGTCLVTEKGRYFLKGRTRIRITSDRVFQSWSFPLVIETTELAVSKYPVLKRLGFRDGTLIQNLADSKIYIISDNRKRHIVSPDVLDRFGMDRGRILYVSDEETNLHENGEELN